MGKTKQTKEKKFDRNVEISAPILDPEIIKQIHTPPKGQRLDIKHGGFKALLSDLNSQDSTDELAPLNDNHIPSYIGISCAVSGYSNYSSYSKRSSSPQPQQLADLKTTISSNANGQQVSSTPPNRSRTTSPTNRSHKNHQQEVHHITIDKNNIHSPDEERKELTEKLTASATERRRSPSPITPTEDDRHHGAYVGARYCPLPPPSKLVNKHIPLLGIDDDKDADEFVEGKENKVEQKIASLYGDNFVEDWRESMTHKAKKELTNEQQALASEQQHEKSPKDLVTLKPTPVNQNTTFDHNEQAPIVDVPTPNVKVLANVEKQFLNKLLTDENPPMPSQSPTTSPVHMLQSSSVITTSSKIESPTPQSPTKEIEDSQNTTSKQHQQQQSQPSSPVQQLQHQDTKPDSPDVSESLTPSPEHDNESQQHQRQEEEDVGGLPMSPDSGKSQSFGSREELLIEPQLSASQMSGKEEHIEYEIRAQSPVDNESSPVKILNQHNQQDECFLGDQHRDFQLIKEEEECKVEEDKLEPAEQSRFVVEEENVQVPLVKEETEVENLVNFSPEPEPLVEQHQEQSHFDSQSSSVTQEQVNNKSEEEVELHEQQEENPINLIESVTLEEEQVFTSEESGMPASTTTTSDNNKDGRYYLDLLDQEKSFILEQIERAQNILKNKESELDEDTLGRIHSAIGKSNLLINKKCNQFKGLCESNFNSGNNLGEKKEQFAVFNDDLAGFWDMLSIQISDIKKSFENLWDSDALKEDLVSL